MADKKQSVDLNTLRVKKAALINYMTKFVREKINEWIKVQVRATGFIQEKTKN